MYRFRIAGEYFDANGDGSMVSGGSFTSIAQAKRAIQAVEDYVADPEPGKIPIELEEVAAVSEPGTLEIALYWRKGNEEEWIMTFDAHTGEPAEVTPNADAAWALMKKGLK